MCGAGKVAFTLRGSPVCQCYCHCQSCRAYHSAPFIAAVIYQKEQLEISAGKDDITKVNISSAVDRFSCSKCHTLIYNDPKKTSLISAFPMCIRNFHFQPQFHVWCSTSVVPVSAWTDGLPKFTEGPPNW